jgi:D-alanyl-D-alanine-carboxypeptidase/D-alanyl-D-alanine-endopeptidase
MTTTDDRRYLTGFAAPLLADAKGATGMVVAVRHGARELVVASGTTDRHGGEAVGPHTRFELGSLTKTFTALLLAEMAARGEVRHHDTVERYLPLGARAPITLNHLATHTSGLPRLPPGLLRSAATAWYTNPYRAFGPDRLQAAFGRTRPRAAPGTRVRYSNFGVGVLGMALARAAGRPFEDLLADRVLRPLGLTETDCATAPQAVGYWRGKPRPPWEIPGLPGAGALRSTGPDMLRYLTAHLVPDSTPLADALADVAEPRVAVPSADHHLCLVWNLRRRPGHDLLFHSGATRGFTSFAGFSPQSRTAFVAMVNAGVTLRSTFVQRSYETLRALAEAPPA